MTAVSVPIAPPTETDKFAQLVASHQSQVWRYVRYLGADSIEADDLVQETFLAIYRSDFIEQGEQQTASYLRTTARNQLLMLRRRQKRDINTQQLDVAEQVWVETYSDRHHNQYLDALADCVAKLSGRAKRAVELHYQGGESREAIANELGMKPQGIKTLLRRTRDSLRECVERRR